jgi:hypothetical protein
VGHNSDSAFQKAVSGAPMPKKKENLQEQSATKKVTKNGKAKFQKASKSNTRTPKTGYYTPLNLMCTPLLDLTMGSAKCDTFCTSTLPLCHIS